MNGIGLTQNMQVNNISNVYEFIILNYKRSSLLVVISS